MTRSGSLSSDSPLLRAPAATTAYVAGRLRALSERRMQPVPPDLEGDVSAAWLIRRTLEELGVRCDERERLEGIDGVLVVSPRGVEMIVSSRLGDAERALVYAHLLAHALLGHVRGEIATRFEYAPGRAPAHLTAVEIEEERIADEVARALLAGRLEATPRYLYQPVAPPAGPTLVGWAARGAADALHRISLRLYSRSHGYRRLRARQDVAGLVSRVDALLAVCAAA